MKPQYELHSITCEIFLPKMFDLNETNQAFRTHFKFIDNMRDVVTTKKVLIKELNHIMRKQSDKSRM
jgi:hypothetical protein